MIYPGSPDMTCPGLEARQNINLKISDISQKSGELLNNNQKKLLEVGKR